MQNAGTQASAWASNAHVDTFSMTEAALLVATLDSNWSRLHSACSAAFASMTTASLRQPRALL